MLRAKEKGCRSRLLECTGVTRLKVQGLIITTLKTRTDPGVVLRVPGTSIPWDPGAVRVILCENRPEGGQDQRVGER